jgi:hypothetical protein
MEIIKCAENKINQDLNIFSHLKNLQKLDLGYIQNLACEGQVDWDKKLYYDLLVISNFKKKQNNEFYGSLKALKNCQNLEFLCLACQNVKGGLEYLPTEKLTHFGCYFTSYADELMNYDYDIHAWQLVNVKEKLDIEKIKQKIAEAEI